jgi:hypothetical protein
VAIRESIRDLKDLQYNEKKKTEKKIQFENNIYKLIKKEFNNTTAGAPACRLELLQNKDYIINTLTPKGLTLYEASKIYNKILNELYKEYTINNDKNELKEAFNNLYSEIESFYIKYNSAAYNILLDLGLKNEILEKYFDLFPENKIDFKKYYDKTIKTLYNEFSNYYENNEQIEEEKKLDWGYFWLTILKILLFPIFVICGTAASRGKGRRKK